LENKRIFGLTNRDAEKLQFIFKSIDFFGQRQNEINN